jgi:IS5 family transposase
MKQMTFADAEFAGKRKQTCKQLFLIKMISAVPWIGSLAWVERIAPYGCD